MRRFLGFCGRSFMRGLRWLSRVSNPLLNLVGVLGLVGIVVVVKVAGLPLWLIVQVVTVLVLTVFAVGAYKEWDDADRAGLDPTSAKPSRNVFTWDGSTYQHDPHHATYIGPVDPNQAGIKPAEGSIWFPTPEDPSSSS